MSITIEQVPSDYPGTIYEHSEYGGIFQVVFKEVR